ncbi:hypothetical protein AQ621_16910 (plasmid) [Marinobacter sp. P4B1]|nr:hypothetical protein AQ621_16910 [Marinobacter sp. P4B1]
MCDGTGIPRYIPDHLARRILFWDDERKESGHIIVCLQNGWSFSSAEHVDVEPFRNVTEAALAIASATPCPCTNCKETVAILALESI